VFLACSGIYYSFATPPHLDIAVRPLGTPLPAEFDGGIAGALQVGAAAAASPLTA
jgi:hypothetical protein